MQGATRVGLVERPHRVRRGQTCSGRVGWWMGPCGCQAWGGWVGLYGRSLGDCVARRTPVSRPFAGGSPKNLPVKALVVARLSGPNCR